MTEEVTNDNYKGIIDAIKDLKDSIDTLNQTHLDILSRLSGKDGVSKLTELVASIDSLNESLAPLSTLKGKDGVSNLTELVTSSNAVVSSLSKGLDAIASKVSGGSSSSEIDKGELIQTIVTKVASWLVKLMV